MTVTPKKAAIIAAVLIVLVLLLAYAVRNRASAEPTFSGPRCTADSDCVRPNHCVSGYCGDPVLYQRLADAQVAAANLVGAVRTMVDSANPSGAYYVHAQGLIAEATKLGLTAPPASMSNALAADLRAGQAGLQSYRDVLAAPSGYVAQIAALTPKSPAGQIMAATGLVQSAVAGAPGSLTSAAADLQSISDFIAAQANAKGWAPLSTMNLASANNQVLRDVATMRGGPLTSLANTVLQTGTLLYQHFA
jgi:hypothetical protein